VTTGLLSIGEVAARTGLKVTAVRYYDEIGLIASTSRVGGKRRFAPDVVGRISFVRRARDAGFTLEEIGGMLDDSVGDWRAVVDAKLDELVERRRRLDTMIDVLREVRRCGCDAVADCPAMDELGPCS